MNSPYVIRPSRLEDIDALMELATLSGPGFTSLPVDETILRKRLDKSHHAFLGDLSNIQHGKYLLMMEDADTGEIVGCSAVKAGTGIDQPFFNYRVITLAQASQTTQARFDMDALVLTNEYVGYTEVGTLFLKAEHRGGGAGRLVAQSRYLLMAAAPDRFSDKVLAELRGVIDDDGISSFWEGLGRHFFRMDFAEADRLSAVSGNQFILDLMPRYPIYVDLLPPEAREVIGRCHSQGVGAYKLLQWEGFEFARTVDIFDGGPLVTAQRRHIRTIQESELVVARASASLDNLTCTGIISNEQLGGFRSCLFEGQRLETGELLVEQSVLDRLKIKSGETVRIWKRKIAE